MPQNQSPTLDEVLSSRGRVRILMILTRIPELNISDIARRVGLNYATTDKHLKELEGARLVQQKRFGRIRIYKLNDLDPRVTAVKKLVDFWETKS